MCSVFILSFFLNFFVFSINAQDSISTIKIEKVTYKINSKVLDSAKLSDQFDFILKNSYHYNNAHSIKDEWLRKFYAHVSDSINKLKTELTINKQQMLAVQNENSALKSEVTANEEIISKKDTISLFGIPMSKKTYQTIVWSLILLLASALIYYVYQFKNSHKITKEAVMRYEELENELQESRGRALEREQALNRQLFDEIKKNEENTKKK